MLESELRMTLSENFNKCWMSYHSTKGFLEKLAWVTKMVEILRSGLRVLGTGQFSKMGTKTAIKELTEILSLLNRMAEEVIVSGELTNPRGQALALIELDKMVTKVVSIYVLTGFAVAKLPYDDAFELVEPSRRSGYIQTSNRRGEGV